MLKIAEYRNVLGEDGKSIRREKIDLKELEKFGFELNDKGQYCKRFTLIFKNRKISGRSGDKAFSKLYIAYELYDLIQAGLVEKVENQK